MCNESVPAKDIERYLISEGIIEERSLTDEVKTLHVHILALNQDTSEHYCKFARLLSGYRNFPFSVYSNHSGGCNTGFLFKVYPFDLDTTKTYFKEDCDFDTIEGLKGENLRSIGLSLVSFLEEVDPSSNYNHYLFC